MTAVSVSLVDVYVLRPAGHGSVELLALRRSPSGRCPGTWETVHGHIDGDEGPVKAAVRELAEEAGIQPLLLYNVSRVEAFYRHLSDEVALVPVFAAMVDPAAAVSLSAEHDDYQWLDPSKAADIYYWPRERNAVRDVVRLLDGVPGTADDVLIVPQALWR